MIPVVYNNGNKIVQAPGYVVLRNEMIHESRIHPARQPPGASCHLRVVYGQLARTVGGQHAGRANDDLNGKNGLQANGQLMLTSDALELVERFTPTAANTLQVPGHDHRSENMGDPLEDFVSAAASAGLSDPRGRVSRGELLDAEYVVRIACRESGPEPLSPAHVIWIV